WRGGMGTIYRWRVEADAIAVANFGGGDRAETVPFGLQGGSAAPQNRLYLHKAGEIIDVDTESFYEYDTGDVFEIYESGGGGYGDAKKRPAEKVQEDVINGLVSIDKAREDYAVIIKEKSIDVDIAATQALRGE
ncbi:MAG: hydantoinase B/oxoprolinase family protein, partial [Gammaproteobacteria bacterium]|nr:hydantoinase B/oxoprolinase family protein [Gammaproteobacteria bacterium]